MKRSGDLRYTIRLFRRFSAGQRRTFLFAFLLLAAEAATAVTEAFPLSTLVKFLQNPKTYQLPGHFSLSFNGTIAALAAAIIVLTALNSLTDSLAEIALAKGGRTIGYNLRVALYSHLQKLSLAFHQRRRTGDVLTRITADVTALEEFVVNSVSDLAGSVLLLAGAVVVLFAKSLQIALLAALMVPLLAIVSNYFASRIKAASKKLRAREGDLASAAQEMLTSISVVQIYGRGSYDLQRFADQSRSAMSAVLSTARLEAGFSFTVSILEAFVLAGIIWVGAVTIGPPNVDAGDLVLYIVLVQGMFKPTKRIIKEFNSVSKIYASVERISDLLDREPAVRDRPGAVMAPRFTGRIDFQDVSFVYQPQSEEGIEDAPPRLALDRITFTVEPGDVVALVGHSGAGKSTIAQLLPRLYDPHGGRVTLDGYDIRDFTLDSLRAQIGMVLQETILFSGTVAENIAYGREGATHEEIVAAARHANAHDFITALPQGYDTPLGERAATLSGGQRQRLAIARAFVRDTQILVLDEPTTGLDTESADLVLQALQKLLRGKSALIVSHDFNLIRAADRIVVISAGRILEEGTPEDLLARGGLYADLYAHQFGPAEPPAAAPLEPAALAFDGDGQSGRSRSRVFETALMEVVPLPASAQAFDQLTGRMPAAPRTRSPQPQHLITTSPTSGPATSAATAVRAGGEEAVDSSLNALRSPTLRRVLPGLAEAMDAAAMAPRLQRLLAPGAALEWCAPGKALVEPGSGASLRYRLGVREPTSGRVVEHIVGGRVFPSAGGAEDWQQQRLMPLAERLGLRADLAAFGTVTDVIEDLRLALHAFPLDPDLPGLIDVTDPDDLARILGSTFAGIGAGLSLVECQPHIVQYARRGRCVIRYEVLWNLGHAARTVKQVAYGKIYGDDEGALVEPAVSAVRTHLQGRSDSSARFLVPRPLGYLPHLRLSLLEALPGVPQISRLVRDRTSGVLAAAQGRLTLESALDTAAGIAATLHTSGIALGRRRTLAGELAMARAAVDAARALAPALSESLDRVLAEIAAEADRDPGPVGFAHGDFTPSQVLFDGPLSGLIDLETACHAEPALDLGQFVAYLDLGTLKAHFASGGPGLPELAASRLFLDSYLRATGCRDEQALRGRVSAYRTLTLVQIAIGSWLQLKPSRVRLAVGLLQQGSAVTQGGRT
ncbi:MAG: ABC transporter transmembrane domain-containing protein [Frankiaceae bacterium]